MRKAKRDGKAVGGDLGNPGRPVGVNQTDLGRVLAAEAHRMAAGGLAEDPQRDHFSHAQRMPVGPVTRAVRAQEHDA